MEKHVNMHRRRSKARWDTGPHCDEEMPKVPAECLMTGSSNEPASRPDASRNCADHPEAGQDPSNSTRGHVPRLCGEKTSRRVRRALGCADHKCKGSTRHADPVNQNEHVLRREVTHGQRSGGCGRRAGAVFSAREALMGVHPGGRSTTREAHSHLLPGPRALQHLERA